jgi:hypothetical protein
VTNFIRDYVGYVPPGAGGMGNARLVASPPDAAVHSGVVAVHTDPGSGSGTQACVVVGSPPWWAGRVVENASEEATPYTVVVNYKDVAREAIEASKKVVMVAPVRFSLDLGSGVVMDEGALFGSADVHVVGSTFTYNAPGVGAEELDYLAPDEPSAISAAQVEDSEWDDDDDGPSWISLADLPYRGGGLMARLRSRSRGG